MPAGCHRRTAGCRPTGGCATGSSCFVAVSMSATPSTFLAGHLPAGVHDEELRLVVGEHWSAGRRGAVDADAGGDVVDEAGVHLRLSWRRPPRATPAGRSVDLGEPAADVDRACWWSRPRWTRASVSAVKPATGAPVVMSSRARPFLVTPLTVLKAPRDVELGAVGGRLRPRVTSVAAEGRVERGVDETRGQVVRRQPVPGVGRGVARPLVLDRGERARRRTRGCRRPRCRRSRRC